MTMGKIIIVDTLRFSAIEGYELSRKFDENKKNFIDIVIILNFWIRVDSLCLEYTN